MKNLVIKIKEELPNKDLENDSIEKILNKIITYSKQLPSKEKEDLLLISLNFLKEKEKSSLKLQPTGL